MEQDIESGKSQLNAYRIKEMGDGFLCSVGFLFSLDHGVNQGDLAIDLAQAFFVMLQGAFPTSKNFSAP